MVRTAPYAIPTSPPLKPFVEKERILCSMCPDETVVLPREPRSHESNTGRIAVIPPHKQEKFRSYLMVAEHPRVCVKRIYLSNVFANKRTRTLIRLSFSSRETVRAAAEFELSLRNQ